MVHQSNHNEEMEDEEFPDESQCFVCLDIMYKPVALACGHVSCFWCVFRAMDFSKASSCPVCRNQYHHFPRICELFHFLLLKLYPRAYKRRERQVADDEKEYGDESPQFDAVVANPQCDKVTNNQDISSPLSGGVPEVANSSNGGDHSIVQDSLGGTSHQDATAVPTTSTSQTTAKKADSLVGRTNKLLVTDVQCIACKQLLCCPVVLNCGHVFCEACIHEHDNVCKCPLCQSAHPRGFPSVCLVLEYFLKEYFPEEYSARKASTLRLQNASHSTKKWENGAESLYSRAGVKFHPGVGCDYCGMCPIIGVRYRCKDCVERVGFDLCEGCYNSSSRLPGRFNQQHTKEHKFEVIQSPSPYFQSRIFDLLASEHSVAVYYERGGTSDADDHGIHVILSRHDDLEDEQVFTPPVGSSGEHPRDLDRQADEVDFTVPPESFDEDPRYPDQQTPPPDSSNEH